MSGARVNFVGLAARLLQPLLVLALTWLFGPNDVGIYLLITSVGDVIVTLSTSGFVDAAGVLGSRDADRARKDEATSRDLYQVLANAMLCSLGVGGIAGLVLYVGAPAIAGALREPSNSVVTGLRFVALSLPFATFASTASSAPWIRFRMEYAVGILGVGRPLFMLAGAALVRMAGAGFSGLMATVLASYVVSALLSAWGFASHFDVRATLREMARPRFHRAFFGLALPQSVSLTTDRYLTRLALLLFAAFGYPPKSLAFYGTSALLAGSVREIKFVFTPALLPIVSRQHFGSDREESAVFLARVSRWCLSLVVPVALGLVVLRGDLLGAVDASYREPTGFFSLLLLAAVAGSVFGFAGDYVVFSRHGGFVLGNAVLALAVCSIGSILWIPAHGYWGAALAALLATLAVSIAQIMELAALLRIRFPFAALARPLVAAVPACAVLAFFWDPASLPSALSRGLVACAAVAAYALALVPFSRSRPKPESVVADERDDRRRQKP